MEEGRGMLLQLSSNLDECVMSREVCPSGRCVVLETKGGLKPSHCQDLFVQVEPQTCLGPSLLACSPSCWKGKGNATSCMVS